MSITFFKYQATGNDFIMIDNTQLRFPKHDATLVAALCHRRFGIGSDGLILIEPDPDSDFSMIYYNSDGHPSSMCGNGGRCAVAFAFELGLFTQTCLFKAVDGYHSAEILAQGQAQTQVRLKMQDVLEVDQSLDYSFLNTGSPHYVTLVDDLQSLDVFKVGRQIRNRPLFNPGGTNVNFVHQTGPETFEIRTYERGVEDETWSCGTGATAVALSMYDLGKTQSKSIEIKVQGGSLKVDFENHPTKGYHQIFLQGPALKVYQGEFFIT